MNRSIESRQPAEGSFNRALLRAAVEMAPPDIHITTHDLAALPLYNADVEASAVPAVVADLRSAVRSADALLIATPEYNHGVPGVLVRRSFSRTLMPCCNRRCSWRVRMKI